MFDARPEVSLNMAMSLDGKVTRPDGGWHGISSPRDRARMDEYRWQADAVFVGRNSILLDDPVVVPENPPPGHGGKPPLPVMIVQSALPPADRQIFRQTRVRPLVFARDSIAALHDPADPNARALRAVADLRPCAAEDATPARVLAALYRERGIRRVLLEGGPRLNHAFFRDDLVDVVYLTLVPFLMGARDLPAIVDGAGAFPDFQHAKFRLAACEPIGDEVFLCYRRAR